MQRGGWVGRSGDAITTVHRKPGLLPSDEAWQTNGRTALGERGEQDLAIRRMDSESHFLN